MSLRIRSLARRATAFGHRLRRAGSPVRTGFVPAALRTPSEVVTSFDAWAYLSDLTSAVSETLARHGVEHLVLPDRILPRPIIAIRAPDAVAAADALTQDGSAANWWWARSRGGLIGRAVPLRSRRIPTSISGVIVRNLVTPGGSSLVDSELGVQLDLWTELTALPGGGEPPVGTFAAAKHNGVLDYVGQDLWSTVQRNGHRLPPSPPHLLSVEEPVDLVYTWVDGSDPAWLARKSAALGHVPASGFSADAAIDARFENRDELLYSLRSVEMFANWVRHIWIVTDSQTPPWLCADDRLTVVDHREIFADPSALPVFNAHAIESQLHHIPGLAERYLYLNDDMLFGSPVRPEDFFHGNRISKFFISPALIDVAAQSGDELAVTAAAKNNRDLIESQFGRTVTNKLQHTPQPQQRSLLEEFEADHPDIFDQVMRSRFMHASDFSLPSSLNQYYAFAMRRAVPARLDFDYVDLASSSMALTLDRWLQRRDLQCFCVNDSGGDAVASHASKDIALRDFFDAYFPLPSRWEQTADRTASAAQWAVDPLTLKHGDQ